MTPNPKLEDVTLRDIFAAMAMLGYLSRDDVEGNIAVRNPKVVAEWAYENADQMLAERIRK